MENKILGEILVPVQLCPPQILHGLAWVQTYDEGPMTDCQKHGIAETCRSAKIKLCAVVGNKTNLYNNSFFLVMFVMYSST